MIWAFALLCSTNLAAADCDSSTAIDVIRFPNVGNEVSCIQDSMMTIASLAIAARSNEYWKFVCIRPNSTEAAMLTTRVEDKARHYQ